MCDQYILRLEENIKGRDFAVGDIHGCFSILEQALAAANFDSLKDRVISVGDLVDRGPESQRALEFLAQDWFYAVRGDHEDIIPDDIVLMNEKGKEAVTEEFEAGGMGWLLELSQEDQSAFIKVFQELPYVIEVPLGKGTIAGFVHAGVPQGLSWGDFTAKLAAGDEGVRQTALRGRSRIIEAHKKGYDSDSGVQGIEKVFTGHSLSIGRSASQMGNVFCIDTGAETRHSGRRDRMFPEVDVEDFHLTLVDIYADAKSICHARPKGDNRLFQVIHTKS